MSKLRHIALIVEDPEASAKFFAEAFGMERAGEARAGCHMSDGVISIALLKKETDDERIGLDHFGVLVDNLEQAQKRAVSAGATPFGERGQEGSAFYEAKLLTPDGIVFDLSEAGWPGATK